MPLTNSDIIRILNKSLDPMMKIHGFVRKGRVYYKQSGDILFLLGTKAVGNYFAAVTGFPSHAFTLAEGFWIEGVDYWNSKVNLTAPKIILPDVFSVNLCFPIQDNADGNIHRKQLHPYPNEDRNDLWIMPEDETEQSDFLEEMQDQIQSCFLKKHEELLSLDKLEEYSIDRLHQYNLQRGYTDDKEFERGDYGGNLLNYLDYAVLFYKKYGFTEKYEKLSARLNDWCVVNKNLFGRKNQQLN